jgi:hypothetical protein
MPQLYENPDQEALHLKAMESLAVETGHEFAQVRQVYEAELARLQAKAHLTEFVLLFSYRRTREILRKPAKAVRAQAVTA